MLGEARGKECMQSLEEIVAQCKVNRLARQVAKKEKKRPRTSAHSRLPKYQVSPTQYTASYFDDGGNPYREIIPPLYLL